MKKVKILFIGAAIFCLPFLTSGVPNPPECDFTFYVLTSCGTYHQFTLQGDGCAAPIAAAHNYALYLSSQDCGPGWPVPKVWMMAP
ncbi:hypothetical protein [Pedobacter sp. ASV28]|uniref:hypothetical protein n=1 Tax=Pedobacter sp. ASV28 TaxID=2795123 RepID=UPI0018EBCA47|nr:hypothetical protein [Pedobacter sp. ASV28]